MLEPWRDVGYYEWMSGREEDPIPWVVKVEGE
jgi:hypothetical protein